MKDEKKEILSLQSIYVGGIDVGSEEHYVSVHPSLSSKPVQTFGCYTAASAGRVAGDFHKHQGANSDGPRLGSDLQRLL